MTSKRKAVVCLSLVLLLSSCSLVRIDRKSSVDAINGEETPLSSSRARSSSSKGISSSSARSSSSKGVSSSKSRSSSNKPSSSAPTTLTWTRDSYYEQVGDTEFSVSHNNQDECRAIWFKSREYRAQSENFALEESTYGGSLRPFRIAYNGEWVEYNLTLDESLLEEFNGARLYIYCGVTSRVIYSSSALPSNCEISINGEIQTEMNTEPYGSLGITEDDSGFTMFYWNSGIDVSFVSGTNVIRYKRTGGGLPYLREFWITKKVLTVQPNT